MALALALTVLGCWLLWAGRQEGGPRTVLATAGLWWLAALKATWQVWVPAGVVLGGLYVAIPPRRRRTPVRPFAVAAPVAPLPAPPVAGPEREPTQDPSQEPPQTQTPASTPTPVRPVWEAFTPLHQERDDGAAS